MTGVLARKASATEPTFLPFYDRLATWLGELPPFRWVPAASKLFLVLAIGALFGFTQLVDENLLRRDRWPLLLLICTAMAAVQYASHTLRSLLPVIDRHLAEAHRLSLRQTVAGCITDRALVCAGIFFGAVNTALGHFFGPPGLTGLPDAIAIGAGYFLVGFVCGIAAWGIVGVVRIVGGYTRVGELAIDFTSPDGCGGTRYIGDALLKFSCVTLLVGVGISYYILGVEWQSRSPWMVVVKWFWIVFPYLMSAYVLFAPALEVNRLLQTHKNESEQAMMARMRDIRSGLGGSNLAPDQRAALRSEYDYWEARRKQLHEMRTWPFGLGTYVRFASAVCSSAIGTQLGFVNEIFKLQLE